MSNVWYYDILIERQSIFAESEVSRIMQIFQDHGYSVWNPQSRRISVTSLDSEKFLSLENLTEAVSYVSKEGGLLDFWQNDVGLGFSFDHAGIHESNVIKVLEIPDGFTYGRLSIVVDDYLFRPSEPLRRELARKLLHVFEDICTQVSSVYGYLVDELVFEHFYKSFHIHEQVRDQARLSILFGLNYITHAHADKIWWEELQHLSRSVKHLPQGYLLSLFEYPWEATVSALTEINSTWQERS